MNGKLKISISGTSGSGKSTLLHIIASALNDNGIEWVLSDESPEGENVEPVLSNKWKRNLEKEKGLKTTVDIETIQIDKGKY